MKTRGVVKGKRIVVDDVVGLPEGQVVEVEILELEDETRTAGNSNGLKGEWTHLRLPPDRFRSLSEIDLGDVEIRVTVINADD